MDNERLANILRMRLSLPADVATDAQILKMTEGTLLRAGAELGLAFGDLKRSFMQGVREDWARIGRLFQKR